VKITTLEEFERLLKLWKELYVLDDVFYHKIISELTLEVSPKTAYSFLIRFLELWGVRRAAIDISPRELSEKILHLKQMLIKMDMSILTANFEDMENEIIKVFEGICRVKKVGPTSASKILHLLRPNLFVMWDTDIAKKFNVGMSPDGYLKFLRKCQDMLKRILELYRQNGISDPESYLFNKFGKPLTKLLDEYNWLSTRRWRERIEDLN